ncbi:MULTISPECIES: ABC transporter ATP-binding protein [unclassified Nocardioides]|uniref:ABC transporter ATP-binding protein n=1 Tax=unclassified Nocardioides TaxID=2615069 RepID=UPI00070198A0|nr:MULTISPECIES: ABC transporter ATP-binding protein [unclassified Nocardioides]KRA38713.1 multidrug ABC transporter ATP-binding protein [Nocardioides sp. Root614]KRA92673.1 multidrug ABC transporter ATP-binding protein [Nocardioides sp. Root682]
MRPSPNVTHLTPDDLRGNQQVLPRVARMLRPYRGKIVLVLVAVVVAAALQSVVPFLTRAVFDDALFPLDGGDPRLHLLAWLVAGMCVIPVVTALIGIGQNWLTSTIGNSAMADLRGDLFEHLQRMELAFFTATKTGAIQSRLANDVAGVRTVLTDTATTIVQNSVTVAAAFAAMVVLSWQLTILTLILMPLFVFLQLRVGRRRQRLARRTQESLSEMTAITEEALSVSGILLAKVFNRSESEVDRYREANHRQTRLQVEQAMTGRSFFAVVQTFFAITPALIYLAAGWIITGSLPVGEDALTAGTLVAFTTLQGRLQMPLLQLMRVSLDVQTSLALFRRIFEYLDLEPAITERPGAVSLDPDRLRGRVEFRDVRFRYPEPRALSGTVNRDRFADSGVRIGGGDEGVREGPTWALDHVSLVVEPGELAAIVGPSGSGKTTATYLVPRFYDVTEGAVLIDGYDVRDLTLSSLADAVGMVTQEPYLFHGTIRDNIAYARPSATAEEIEQAARDANIHDRILSFTEGYETITGERGYRLSGGEKQRLAIARVLLKDPAILILDEATSALDNETERLVQEALERATRSRTTIAIAHRLSTIRSADVIFGLEDGRLVERGSHEDLITAGGLYKRLYDEQFSRAPLPTGAGDPRRADIPL